MVHENSNTSISSICSSWYLTITGDTDSGNQLRTRARKYWSRTRLMITVRDKRAIEDQLFSILFHLPSFSQPVQFGPIVGN